MGEERGSPRVESAPSLSRDDVIRIVAPNPGPMTLEGTNTYLVGSDPCLLIDPGPADAGHLERITVAAEPRGGIGGILLTHSHLDHSEAVARIEAPVLWGSAEGVDEGSQLAVALEQAAITPVGLSPLADPATVEWPPGSNADAIDLVALPTPGHAADHVCFIRGQLGFCGDLLLGYGSTIVPPQAAGGSLADYMASLDRLEAEGCELLCSGHGPWIEDPRGRIDEQRRNRLEREQALRDALAAGVGDRDELLSRVWAEVAPELRSAAALSLQSHLEKLAGEGLDLAAVGAG